MGDSAMNDSLALDDEDRLPWLEPAYGDDADEEVSLLRLGVLIVAGLVLLALIVGVGLFKGNIASQVGELYKPGDLRRAMAFQIFYIAINVSVIAAPLISGTLGEKVGWHWGFGSAAVGMLIGLACYLTLRAKYLPGIGDAPEGKGGAAPLFLVNGVVISAMTTSGGNVRYDIRTGGNTPQDNRPIERRIYSQDIKDVSVQRPATDDEINGKLASDNKPAEAPSAPGHPVPDRVEVVDAHQDEAHRLVLGAFAEQGTGQTLFKQRGVGKSGDRIDAIATAQAAQGGALLGDITQDNDRSGRL